MEPTIVEIARRVRSREISSTELVQRSLAAVRDCSSLNAFISLDPEIALTTAAAVDRLVAAGLNPGELAGVPIVIKDNMNVAGLQTTAGTRGIHFLA